CMPDEDFSLYWDEDDDFGLDNEPVFDEHVYPEYLFDVPYVPTSPELVDAMLRFAGTGPGDVVYDLGCGDGRIAIAAAEKFGARAVGIEIDEHLIAEARSNAALADTEGRVRFVHADFHEAHIADATVVAIYLLPEVNLLLKPRFLQELRPGTRIVSNYFGMGEEWPADRTTRVGQDLIQLWRVP